MASKKAGAKNLAGKGGKGGKGASAKDRAEVSSGKASARDRAEAARKGRRG